MPALEFAAVHELDDGLIVLTPEGARPSVSSDELRRGASVIREGATQAVVYTPWQVAADQLIAPTETVVLARTAYSKLSADVLADVSGGGHFEDPFVALLDVQWRLALAGCPVQFFDSPPISRKYMDDFTDWRMRSRGIFAMIEINLASPLRGRYLSVLQASLVHSSFASTTTDTTALDLQRSPGGDDIGALAIPADGIYGAFAIDASLERLSDLTPIRKRVQENRRVPRGRVLRPAFKTAIPVINSLLGVPDDEFWKIGELLALDALLDEPVRVLLVAPATGPCAVRQDDLEDRLSDLSIKRLKIDGERITHEDEEILGLPDSFAEWADVIVLTGTTLDEAPGVAFVDAPIVADFGALDVLGFLMNAPRSVGRAEALAALLGRADLVIASDDVQRDILLGALAGEYRINAPVYDDDASLTRLIVPGSELDALEAFCRSPRVSADRSEMPETHLPPKPSDWSLVLQYMREGGVSNVSRKALGRMKRLAAQTVGRNN